MSITEEPGTWLSDVRKIAVSWIHTPSDLVAALPALESLRATYPQAEISLWGEDWLVAFLSKRAGPVDKALSKSTGRFVEKTRPDLAIDFFRSIERPHLDARHSVGVRDLHSPRQYERWIFPLPFQNRTLKCLEMVSLVGAAPNTLLPRLAVREKDYEDLFNLASFPPAYFVIAPLSGISRSSWAAENFAEVANAVAAQGFHPVVYAAPPHHELGVAVSRLMLTRSKLITTPLSVAAVFALVCDSSLVLGNELGILHLAVSADVPTIGLYTPFDYLRHAPLFQLNHRAHVSWSSVIDDISAWDVVDSATDLLGVSRLRHQAAS